MRTEDAIESIKRYVERGIPTGDFLRAVLSNDLIQALGRADESSRENLFEICTYIYNGIPSETWGSPRKYEAWLDKKHKERINESI